MSKKETGGSAFPIHPGIDPSWYTSTGMTLRDYFAGQALAGMLNSKALSHLNTHTQAAKAYEYADAMLEARK